jgi:altronate dehydratase small subunit
MLRKSLMIDPEDSVAMVLEDSKKGDTIETARGRVTLLENIEFAHKVAVVPLHKGDPVIKYHEEIGYAKTDIPVGAWIHQHNMGCDRGRR